MKVLGIFAGLKSRRTGQIAGKITVSLLSHASIAFMKKPKHKEASLYTFQTVLCQPMRI